MNETSLPMAEDRFSLNPMYLFRWEPTQDAHVLLYPEGIVKLNQTAAEIIEHCDGRNVAGIVAALQARYPGDDERVAAGVYKFLEVFRAKGWIRRQA
ncbi:MAG TPA: pyrroloquinoline quinone biosynthesis peptide chaperone PqqD [Aromatoleum sp.]|uniref:pyrroloquinoline quinone biosynthesis peptide chaperone PqqD n=1 Tax=Aromatoleum sp. TaxID=2307007 RepID=UPI002B49F048|nr:pyrroloquinoline quinone biosynthesis peptide chaperone PqqD [Aromatoleum sp.]HJV27032.1 pyrroloquinoline quinone biosynthesis peptide chaperone PqqD [Aromatoleum sp.]